MPYGAPDAPIYGEGPHSAAYERLQKGQATAAGRGSSAYDAQLQGLAAFEQQAAGQGPSLAEAQLQSGLAQAQQQQRAMGAQARGGNIAGQQLQAANVGAQMSGQAAQQAAIMKQQEMLAGQQAQAQMAMGMGQQQQAMEMGYAGMQGQSDIAQMQTTSDYNVAMRGLAEQERQGRFNRITGGIQMGANMAGGIAGGAMLSEPFAKQGMQQSGLAGSQAVGELEPKTFEYKPQYGAPGERVGFNVAEVQQDHPELVVNTPHGRALDAGGMAAMGLAASSEQEHRIRQLEQRLQQAEAPQPETNEQAIGMALRRAYDRRGDRIDDRMGGGSGGAGMVAYGRQHPGYGHMMRGRG